MVESTKRRLQSSVSDTTDYSGVVLRVVDSKTKYRDVPGSNNGACGKNIVTRRVTSEVVVRYSIHVSRRPMYETGDRRDIGSGAAGRISKTDRYQDPKVTLTFTHAEQATKRSGSH